MPCKCDTYVWIVFVVLYRFNVSVGAPNAPCNSNGYTIATDIRSFHSSNDEFSVIFFSPHCFPCSHYVRNWSHVLISLSISPAESASDIRCFLFASPCATTTDFTLRAACNCVFLCMWCCYCSTAAAAAAAFFSPQCISILCSVWSFRNRNTVSQYTQMARTI